MSLDETLPTGGLPVGHMQFVEIAREVDKENARVVVFDEPTAVLTESEASELGDSRQLQELEKKAHLHSESPRVRRGSPCVVFELCITIMYVAIDF